MHARPAAIHLATGCLLLALTMSIATCRLDKLVTPRIHDRLIISPTSLVASANAGSSVPVNTMLRLASADGAILSWRAAAKSPWLTLVSSSGGAPDSTIVKLRADTLSQVVHHDTIAFTSMQSPGDTVKVPVEFTPQPFLQIDTPGQAPDGGESGVEVDRLGQPQLAPASPSEEQA